MYINLITIDLCPGQSGGGIHPAGTLTISKNGMYNVHLTGELNGMYGKTHSERSKQLMSEKAKQRVGEKSSRRRPVQASTGEIFYTMIEAAKWAGCLDSSSIGKACKGITKTAGRHPVTKEKLSWQYRDDLK